MYMPIGSCWIFRRGERPVEARIFNPDDYMLEVYMPDTESKKQKQAEKKDFHVTGFCPVSVRD